MGQGVVLQQSRRRRRRASRSGQQGADPLGDPGRWRLGPAPPADWPSRSSSWELALVLLLVAILVTGAATLFLTEMWLADRVLPGVRVMGVDLGGLAWDQALERLTTDFRYPQDRYPILHIEGQAWPVSPEDVGVSLDAEATVAAAMVLGHQGDLRTRLEEQADILRYGHEVQPVYATDRGAAVVFVRDLAHPLNRPARNATMTLKDDLTVEVTPAQVGREAYEQPVSEELVRRMVAMEGGDVELVVRDNQPVVVDLSGPKAEVEAILQGPIVLTAPGFDPWVIEPETLADWLIIEPSVDAEGRATLSVDLDFSPARPIAEEIAATVARDPVDAKFSYNVAREAVITEVESVLGQRLDVTSTIALIERAATDEQRAIPLPLVSIPPRVASADAPPVHAFELLGEGKSSYTGSTSARVQNIVVGTRQFDGVLVPPGKTFSFNRTLGEISAEQGYADSIIIWGNETRTDVGGGLCQVSSTAFRAAFWAGLPIKERWPHTFRVSYYEPPKGMDASIYSPSLDFRWVNDTDNYILIRTEVDTGAKTVTFRYYGVNPGRTVEMDGPYESRLKKPPAPEYRNDPSRPKGQTKQIQWAKDGLDVRVYRIIKEDSGEERREEIFSRYRPWQAVYLVGTKED